MWDPPRLFAIDLRTLGLFRIYLGLLLIGQWVTLWIGAEEFLSDLGVLPSHYVLFNPIARGVSLLAPFSTLAEVRGALIGILGLYVAFLLGLGGLMVRVLTLAAAVSLLLRNLWVENGGHVVINLLLVWSLLLPLSDRFSWRRRGALAADLATPGAVRGLAPLGVRVSIALIYFFNFLTKTGETWQSGTAVHYTLWMAERVWPWAVAVREALPAPLLQVASHATLAIEGMLPFLILSPLFPIACQRAAAVLIFLLHASIALMINLGPFSFAMFGCAVLLLQSEDWEWLRRGRGAAAREEAIAAPLRIGWGMRQALAGLLTYTCIVQSIQTYRMWMGTTTGWRPPAWTQLVVDYLRVPQNWRMFAADAPVEARLVRYIGVRGNGLTDLATGKHFPLDDPGALAAYFERAQGQSILRIEWDTRLKVMPADHHLFLQARLRLRHPEYEGYRVYLLTRPSPTPGTLLRSPVSAELVADLP